MKRWIKIGVIVMLTLWIAPMAIASDKDNGASVGATNLVVAHQTDNAVGTPVDQSKAKDPFDRDFDFPSNLVGTDKMQNGMVAPVAPRDFDFPDGR